MVLKGFTSLFELLRKCSVPPGPVPLIVCEDAMTVFVVSNIFFFVHAPDMHVAELVRFIVCNGITPLSAADVLRFTSVDVTSRRLLRDTDVLRVFATAMSCGRVMSDAALFRRWAARSRCLECGAVTACTPAVSASGRVRARFCTSCTSLEGGFRQLADRKRCRLAGLEPIRVAKVGLSGKHLVWVSSLDAAVRSHSTKQRKAAGLPRGWFRSG